MVPMCIQSWRSPLPLNRSAEHRLGSFQNARRRAGAVPGAPIARFMATMLVQSRRSKPNFSCVSCIWWFLILILTAFQATAQPTNFPITYSAIYGYAITNDIPNEPLVTISIFGATNVSCLTLEQTLPSPATALNVSGDGVYLPAVNAIRWGPYFNLNNTNPLVFSYRLTGLPGAYPVNGGAWLDGQTWLSPGFITVPVLEPAGVPAIPTAPPLVATPVFTPASGASVPVSVTITDATPGSVIYYTTNGSQPTQSSMLYTGAVYLASASVVRAAAFTNGWTPSVAALAYYGVTPTGAVNAQVTQSVNVSSPAAPVVTFNVVPGTNANCEALTATLPAGVSASNISAGGNYVASNNLVLWGPFFGTNAQTLSFQAAGMPGAYQVNSAWSVDGVSGSGTVNVTIGSATGIIIPSAPSLVATPVFTPANGASVPVSVTITDATPGAVIYYTTNGSLPTQSSILYTGVVYLASASVVRAAAFTNGWTPSLAALAYYGVAAAPPVNAQVTQSVNTNSPAAPVVSFNLVPGANANCAVLTATLPPNINALNVSAGGNYVASNNTVLWGPFFGTNAQTLSFQAAAPPGVYPVSGVWSVDGVSASGSLNLAIGSASGSIIPSAPQQVPTPVLSPPTASNLPVTVTISCSDTQAVIYFTTDGTLPTQSSALYTGSLTFTNQTTLRAAAFHSGYQSSVTVLGQYVPAPAVPTVVMGQSVSGNGSVLPTVNLMVTPQGTGNCYAVVETIPGGITPSGLSGDGVFDPVASVIRWGPYLDNQPRYFAFNVGGYSGTYPFSGMVSCNGYWLAATNTALVQINASYTGSAPATNLAACSSEGYAYTVNINPAPGVITVTAASGTVNWDDGTQSTFSNTNNITLPKTYTATGTYTITLSANWWGYSGGTQLAGLASRSDTIQVVTSCGPPQIVTQPTNLVVAPAATAQFSVYATGAVAQAYQWYYNQTNPLAGATAATLTLTNVGVPAAGLYSVVISNAFGSVTSTQASLVVMTPNVPPTLPVLATQLVNELTLLTVTNTATNASVPAVITGYRLVTAPTNMVISANGIITWTPAQAQSPGTNLVTTIVTNNNPYDTTHPYLTATNTFTVIVREVNVAPWLGAISTQIVNELTLLTVTNAATNANIHSTMAGFGLVNPPAGATITSNGVFSWTPQPTQSPATNLVTVVVTNSNPYDLVNPKLTTTNQFTVVVREVNAAPVLSTVTTQIVNELTLLTLTNAASEANIHSTLGYALVGAPPGMSINSNGVVTWTPQQTQSPATNLITTIVTNRNPYDLVNPSLSATNQFTVIVREVNVAPVLPSIVTQNVTESNLLTVVETASESNLHSTLAYSLVSAPAGMSISASGVITWTPTDAQKSTTNTIIAAVTNSNPYDLVNPHLGATNSFAVIVHPLLLLTSPVWLGSGWFQFGLNDTTAGVAYTIETSTNLVDWVLVYGFEGTGGPITVFDPNAGDYPCCYYRVRHFP